MKKLTFLILILFLFSLVHAKAQTLHLLMVSDYANPTFGKVTLENEVNIEQMFGRVSSNLDYKLNKVYLNTTNKLFNRIAVITALNNLKTNPEDIVIFYYNGFGFYPPQSKSDYPTFQLNNTDNKTLSFDDISTQLSIKNNRLGMVIADLRQTENMLLEPIPESGMTAAEELSKIITQKIFLEQSGIYKILSAKKGMPSYPHFTESFTNSFYRTLEISDSELIKQINLDDVLNITQTRINAYISLSVNKTPQQIQWSFNKLNKKVKSYQSPYFNIPTHNELKAQLHLLANPVDSTQRSNIESNTRAFFTPDASIIVQSIPSNNTQTVNQPIKMSLEQYIQQTATYNAKVKRTIEFKVFDFRRSKDFKKFTELRITEIIN
jgi:hypothetical protein